MEENKDDFVTQRYELAIGRIREIYINPETEPLFRDFFCREAGFLIQMDELFSNVKENIFDDMTLEDLRAYNRGLYEELLPGNYENSYGNPGYAVKILGRDYGQILSMLYTELRGTVVYAYEQRIWDMTIGMELFLEIYQEFETDAYPREKYLRESIYYYMSDYADELMQQSVDGTVDPACNFAVDIIMNSDLTDPRYLYQFGEYVTKNEETTAAFLNTLPEEEIEAMALTFTEGYRTGFLVENKPLEKKKTVNIRYTLGFERIVRCAIRQFADMGLKPTIYRTASHIMQKNQKGKNGYYGAVPNQQFEFDHKNDAALFIDKALIQRKLRALQNAYENQKEKAARHGGPAVMEIFGEKPFEPVSCKDALTLSVEQQKLQVLYDNEAGQIVNRYIIGEERSFTIIAYPVPEIGADFEKIFEETVKVNTLDYKKYQRIQQSIIEVLDLGVCAHVVGMNGNRTDITISFHELTDPSRQTNFENCVADVNIPVGEVFTSPILKGTDGVLNVSKVFLNELNYVDLTIQVKDGMISDYSCKNFDDEGENRRYIEENILFHHDTIPMGEFAIGTNTTAYRMARTYHIEDKLPILIAEKTGPHFAFGDTCYSWQEDTAVYNPDGKEIIARDNERSLLRKKDVNLAYFGCHTDITIPYDELGLIEVIRKDGTRDKIIEKGRFVLPGTEELNEPLAEHE